MTHYGRKEIGEFDTDGVLKMIETKGESLTYLTFLY